MPQKLRFFLIILILTALIAPPATHAAVVGRFSLVKGQVDLLKQGNLPAMAAKFPVPLVAPRTLWEMLKAESERA